MGTLEGWRVFSLAWGWMAIGFLEDIKPEPKLEQQE